MKHYSPSVIAVIVIAIFSLVGGTIMYIASGHTQPVTIVSSPQASISNVGSVEGVSLRSSAPEVFGIQTSLFVGSRLQEFVGRSLVREGNTNGGTLGVRAAQDIGYGQYLLGKEPPLSGVLQAIQTSTLVGQDIIVDHNLITDKIELLAQAVPLLEIDVYDLLSQSTDRFTSLTDHIRALDDAYEQLREGIADLDAELATIVAQLNDIAVLKKQEDQAFFSSAKQLLPQASYDALEQAIFLKERQAKLDAQRTALQTIREFFLIVGKKVERKYTSLRANQDALVKGVVVVDIKNMEPDLIITEAEWRAITGITD